MRKLLVIFGVFLFVTSVVGMIPLQLNAEPSHASHDSAASQDGKSNPKPHANHNPQHGGIFFMALDNKHHLEGVLLPTGVFRVYLYDAYTRPLSTVKVQQTSGTVEWGDKNFQKKTLVTSTDGQTLEVALGKDLKLPVTLNLSLRLPNSLPGARPEVFTFPFSHFIADDQQSSASASVAHAAHEMTGMKMDH